MGERNDMACMGVEHKMGLQANATTALSFGENGKCRGLAFGQRTRRHEDHVPDDERSADRAKLLEDNDEATYYYAGRALSSQFYISSDFPKFFGKAECDALVNNAGTTKFCSHDDLEGLTDADFVQIYRTNVVGPRRSGPRLRI